MRKKLLFVLCIVLMGVNLFTAGCTTNKLTLEDVESVWALEDEEHGVMYIDLDPDGYLEFVNTADIVDIIDSTENTIKLKTRDSNLEIEITLDDKESTKFKIGEYIYEGKKSTREDMDSYIANKNDDVNTNYFVSVIEGNFIKANVKEIISKLEEKAKEQEAVNTTENTSEDSKVAKEFTPEMAEQYASKYFGNREDYIFSWRTETPEVFNGKKYHLVKVNYDFPTSPEEPGAGTSGPTYWVGENGIVYEDDGVIPTLTPAKVD